MSRFGKNQYPFIRKERKPTRRGCFPPKEEHRGRRRSNHREIGGGGGVTLNKRGGHGEAGVDLQGEEKLRRRESFLREMAPKKRRRYSKGDTQSLRWGGPEWFALKLGLSSGRVLRKPNAVCKGGLKRSATWGKQQYGSGAAL